jgi:Thiol-disulfide isomerase and thioredoxins
MNYRTIVLALHFLLYYSLSFGQVDIQPLSTGDNVPAVPIHIINSDSSVYNLSDLKGKGIILDFWATWCKPCVADLPKADSIQKAYMGKLEIIPVTNESAQKVQPLLEKIKKNLGIKVRTVVNDQLLHKLFPHTVLPHYVWISPEGKVTGITDWDGLSSQNITLLLDNKLIKSPTKDDQSKITKLNYAKPIFAQQTPIVNDSNMISYSILTKYIPQASMAVGGAGGQIAGKGQYKIMITNETPVFLFTVAYAMELTGNLFMEESRVLLETKDSLKYTVGKGPAWDNRRYTDWITNNGVCYDLQVPITDSANLYKIMQKDLERYFPLTAKIEKRKTKCYNLVTYGNSQKYKSKTETAIRKRDFTLFNINYQKVPMNTFLLDLQQLVQGWEQKLPVINSVNYDGLLDLDLNGDFRNFTSLREQLQRCGLNLIEEEIDVDMLVIRDR